MVEIVKEIPIEAVIVDDSDDDALIVCAIGGEANYIVSGDKHLLKLGQYKDIKICTLAEFMPLLPQS